MTDPVCCQSSNPACPAAISELISRFQNIIGVRKRLNQKIDEVFLSHSWILYLDAKSPETRYKYYYEYFFSQLLVYTSMSYPILSSGLAISQSYPPLDNNKTA